MQRQTERRAVLARAVGERLQAVSEEKIRQWWERYLKGAVAFRGVPMGKIRIVIREVWAEQELQTLDRDDQISLALSLFAEPYCEDKLAGVLALAELCMDHLTLAHVGALASPFERGYIADWSSCDWYCVKVLGPFVERGPDRRERAEAIAAWRFAEGLWQRRAAAVAFANLAPKAGSVFPGFAQVLLSVCEVNAADPARFSQTSVGWVLRELSHSEPVAVKRFVDDHREKLSREAIRMATAKLEPGNTKRRR